MFKKLAIESLGRPMFEPPQEAPVQQQPEPEHQPTAPADLAPGHPGHGLPQVADLNPMSTISGYRRLNVRR